MQITMSHLRTYITSATLASLALLLAVAPATSEAQQNRDDARFPIRLDTTFAFGTRGSGEIAIPSGDVIVRGWSEPRVRVRAATERGVVRAEGTSSYFTLGLRGQYSRGTDTRFEVWVPVGTRLRITTQSGNVTIGGTKAEVEAGTQSGDIELEDVGDRVAANVLSGDVSMRRVAGDVRVSAVSGDIDLTDVTGDVEISSVSGDITLRGVTSRRVRTKTTSGDVTYDGVIDPAGRYDFGSHSGDVDILLPANASTQVTVATFSGGIVSDFPITLSSGTHDIGITSTKRFTFNVGKGEARLTAESFSGDVTIRQRGRTTR